MLLLTLLDPATERLIKPCYSPGNLSKLSQETSPTLLYLLIYANAYLEKQFGNVEMISSGNGI